MAGTLGHGCKAQAKARRKLYETGAQKHARQFGKALGLSASDLLWGLGLVGSPLHFVPSCVQSTSSTAIPAGLILYGLRPAHLSSEVNTRCVHIE